MNYANKLLNTLMHSLQLIKSIVNQRLYRAYLNDWLISYHAKVQNWIKKIYKLKQTP